MTTVRCLSIPQHSSPEYIYCSLWPLGKRKKKKESLIRPQVSEVFLFSMGKRLSTSQATAAQRAMHFWNDNHLTVRFCDTLRPH